MQAPNLYADTSMEAETGRLLGAEEPSQGEPPHSRTNGLKAWGKRGLVGGAAVALAGVGLFVHRRWLQGAQQPAKLGGVDEFVEKQATWNVDPNSQCPQLEVDWEYEDPTSGFGQNFDHIPSPEMCCAFCQSEPRCQSFTWVKDAGLPGQPSQCWLKGGKGARVQAFGKVSGAAPPKPALGPMPAGSGLPGNALWCFSLMMPTGYESQLLAYQHEKQVSIFACDGFAVYSNAEIQVAPGVVTKVVESDLHCAYGGDSQTALNSWIFIAVWDKICDDAEYRSYNWVVKVDPDCVFFPHRLLAILPAYQNAQYLNNCQYGMHGPIEVFSMQAIDTLAFEFQSSEDGKAPKRCVTDQDFGQWGEDMFMDQCLSKVLGLANHPLETRLMCEDKCDCKDFYFCKKGNDRVSYHPFKSVGAYETCLANAMQDQMPASAYR